MLINDNISVMFLFTQWKINTFRLFLCCSSKEK